MRDKVEDRWHPGVPSGWLRMVVSFVEARKGERAAFWRWWGVGEVLMVLFKGWLSLRKLKDTQREMSGSDWKRSFGAQNIVCLNGKQHHSQMSPLEWNLVLWGTDTN